MTIGYVEAMGLEDFLPPQQLTQGEIYPAEYAGHTGRDPRVLIRGAEGMEVYATVVPSRAKRNTHKRREDIARSVLQQMQGEFTNFRVRLISSPDNEVPKVVIYT
tara:strand:- start:1388 stop:1702 length:315 start_codon:yes stop_codon:yes gene_type:complete